MKQQRIQKQENAVVAWLIMRIELNTTDVYFKKKKNSTSSRLK